MYVLKKKITWYIHKLNSLEKWEQLTFLFKKKLQD